MTQPFLRYLVLSIALSISLSRGKSTRMRKKEPFKPAPNDYEETCFDEEQARCENFEFFCGTRSRYMSQNCMLTCKMCEKGDPVTDLSSKCAVKLEKHKETLCLIKEWIDTCPHSCKEFICDNRAVDCEAMAKEGGCVSEHKYMTEHCKLSCLMCTPGDAVMDLTSECNPKQALCNGDQEWQSICPYTCRRYLPLQARQAQIAPPQNVNQPQVPVQPQLQQAGGVVQQPQQPVQQQALPPNQPQVSPQVGPQAGTAVQTSQLQPQLQQPVIPNQSQGSPATQTAPQVTQPLQLQPQVQQTTSQVNPAMQTSQGQPQIQPTAPQVTSVLQPVQPQIQQVNPVMQSNQLQPQIQPAVSQTQPPYVQQQVQQQQPNQVQYPAGQMQAPQTSYQPPINQGQLPQQPQFGTVGPMKKQKETKPAKGSIVFEKTSSSQETVKKGKAKKVNFRRKMKATEGSKAKGKENTKKGKDTNNDLRLSEKIYGKKKKLLTRLKEESGSTAEHTIKVRKLHLQ